jgi:hypothetical protein
MIWSCPEPLGYRGRAQQDLRLRSEPGVWGAKASAASGAPQSRSFGPVKREIIRRKMKRAAETGEYDEARE